MNRHNRNTRKHKRGAKNLFWLVKSTRKRLREPLLFNRKPYLTDWSFSEYSDEYENEKLWFSVHGEHYPNQDVLDRFPEAENGPVPVKLIIIGDYERDGVVIKPDMYIQRYKDCLFMHHITYTWYKGADPERKYREVPHVFRISNKLLPEVTEESGFVGVKIVKYDE